MRSLSLKTSALYYKLEKYGIGVIESRGGASDAAARTNLESDGLLDDGPHDGMPAKGERKS